MNSKECSNREDLLLKRLAATEAILWSPYDAYSAAQAISDILTKEGQIERSRT
jgi:hypothetical protein